MDITFCFPILILNLCDVHSCADVCVRVCVSGRRTDVTVRCQVNQDTAAVLRTTCSEMSGQDRAAFGTHMSALLCTHL